VIATNLKLTRTLLSTKPQKSAGWVSLLALFVLLVAFAVYQEDTFGLAPFLTADFSQLFTRHEYWRAFTTTLVHADLEHFSSNALFFGGLAYLLNGYFGFWVFPVLSFIAGGLINFIVLWIYASDTTIVGASGVVYFMAAFWLAHYLGIERRLSKIRRAMNAAAFTLVLFVPEVWRVHVSYLSHAVGFGLGALAGALVFIVNRHAIRGHEVWVEVDFGVGD
jgi:rhomboid protease GluP